MAEKLTSVQAIKRFFEAQPHGRPVTMDELKACSSEERKVLGAECCKVLGAEMTDVMVVTKST